ncbi:ovochymase-1 [Trichonephila clavata]|uniref:Ovochymase-1 n=1 Tax=Trichonephila clavata TaxID=2740835 RepID=A0A8X6HBZ7_TRICU|nr:ovochymase-1 [Trichonephila clavata]
MAPLSILLFTFLLIHQQTSASEEEPYQCHDLEEFDATEKGEITSPFYSTENGSSYPSDLWCEYKITAPEGHRIKLTFLDFDIDPSDSCGTDKLVVYGKNKETVIGIFCGLIIPRPVISHEDESEIRLLFQSDYLAGGRGFRLEYESGPDIELCKEDEGICHNRNCYHQDKRCDDVDDCGDGTDEEDCGKTVAKLSEECGKPPIKPDTIYGGPDRIVGGEPAVPNSWPWQVSIQRGHIEPNGHFCGGTLISPQWVVSAAHCFANNPLPSSVRLVFGSHNKYQVTKYQQARVAEKIISYPDLEGDELRKGTIHHDITLIKLNAPVTYNDGVQPACLPHLGWEARPGWECYATGWGETRGSGHSDVLKQVRQVILDKENCTHNEETQICVEKTFNSPCHGDSGGPLVCRLAGQWYVLGATSFGTATNFMSGLCAMPNSKVVFSKVADKGDWIRKLMDMYS